MSFRNRIERLLRNYRVLLGGLAALLLLFTLLFYLSQRGRDLPAALVTNKVLLFVLWYVNVILILVVAFVLLRNLIKLLVERRHRILGSNFKFKLVATYVGLSLIPVLILFFIAMELLQGSFDRWFNTPLAPALERGNAVAHAFYDHIESTALHDASRALQEVRGIDLEQAEERPRLTRRLQELLAELDLDLLAVYEGEDLVNAVVDSQSGIPDLPEPGRDFLREAARQGRAVRMDAPAGAPGRLVLAAVSGAGITVVAGTLLDPAVAEQTDQLVRDFQSYRQLEVQKDDIRASHVLLFIMVTLLVLLGASWAGLYLARRVTVPIQALAEGTRAISGGDLSHRVDVEADDELGVLVDSFNRMTAELESNKEALERSNRELVEAQRLAAWNEAARRIAHEIKNPLTPIRLSAERLLRKHQQRDPGIGKAIEEGVDIIVREVVTLQGMVDEFSRYARMPRPRPAPVDLERLVGDTLSLYRDLKPGVEVEGQVEDGASPAMLDAEQMRRALINLLDNAVEATEAPGKVTVSAMRDNSHLRIRVADTGRGIPLASREKLFLPYYSTKGRGTGLGLAIVHRIVTDHHGSIRVEDNVPQGTVFTVELPAE
ncbi:MAG: two-component system, NtrC family, nitrogen regulation sensor histidine kinase NtrY [Acidobacteriota bacterium]|nr:two-component system, NtrC family, nitrogen regulation sensor histidine kinase NtrY [Acidobacteriota bacterium]